MRARLPLAADRILHRIRETRGGKLYDPAWKKRMVGDGEYAGMIGDVFHALCARLGYEEWSPVEDDPRATPFQRPAKAGQLSLFPR